MEININFEAFNGVDLEKLFHVEKYAEIMRRFGKEEIFTSKDLRRTFNGFYRIRRNVAWQDEYYSYMDAMRGKSVSFEDILRYMYKKTGRIEASFSSKLFATLCPEQPIWDKFVLINFGLKLKGTEAEEKISNAVKIYSEIEKRYSDCLKTEKAREAIEYFDKKLPEYSWISSVKKVDFLIWGYERLAEKKA